MLTKELCCQFLSTSFYTHTEHCFPVICLDNSDTEPMLQQILPKRLQLMCQQWLICSAQKGSCTGAAAPPWKNHSVLQASTEPKTHTSSSTEHRCEDRASFSKLAEGNTGAITPPLPNPQITLIRKSIQMVERATGQALLDQDLSPAWSCTSHFTYQKFKFFIGKTER